MGSLQHYVTCSGLPFGFVVFFKLGGNRGGRGVLAYA